MAPPKKLTFKQRQEKEMIKQMQNFHSELQDLHVQLRQKDLNQSDYFTIRQKALNIFKMIEGQVAKDNVYKNRYMEKALELARHAQVGLNNPFA